MQPVITRLNRELVEVLNQPEAKAALTAQGMNTEPSTPAALRARVAGDIEKWRSVVAKAGIQAE